MKVFVDVLDEKDSKEVFFIRLLEEGYCREVERFIVLVILTIKDVSVFF